MNLVQQAQGGQQYASNFSRSQSRVKQLIYNNIGLGQNQLNGKPSFIGAGGMANAKGPMMVPPHMLPG